MCFRWKFLQGRGMRTVFRLLAEHRYQCFELKSETPVIPSSLVCNSHLFLQAVYILVRLICIWSYNWVAYLGIFCLPAKHNRQGRLNRFRSDTLHKCKLVCIVTCWKFTDIYLKIYWNSMKTLSSNFYFLFRILPFRLLPIRLLPFRLLMFSLWNHTRKII